MRLQYRNPFPTQRATTFALDGNSLSFIRTRTHRRTRNEWNPASEDLNAARTPTSRRRPRQDDSEAEAEFPPSQRQQGRDGPRDILRQPDTPDSGGSVHFRDGNTGSEITIESPAVQRNLTKDFEKVRVSDGGSPRPPRKVLPAKSPSKKPRTRSGMTAEDYAHAYDRVDVDLRG